MQRFNINPDNGARARLYRRDERWNVRNCAIAGELAEQLATQRV